MTYWFANAGSGTPGTAPPPSWSFTFSNLRTGTFDFYACASNANGITVACAAQVTIS
jgi:hypothetical protein